MEKFEVTFYLGDTQHKAEIIPEESASQIMYTCIISKNIIFKIRKNKQNKWENLDGNVSAMSKLIGWEIDNHLKQVSLKKKSISSGFDINLS
jgi:hypothetical protein